MTDASVRRSRLAIQRSFATRPFLLNNQRIQRKHYTTRGLNTMLNMDQNKLYSKEIMPNIDPHPLAYLLGHVYNLVQRALIMKIHQRETDGW